MLGAAGFAVAGAVGSIVSQGVGIAVGAQDKFSWSGVAMGALATVAGGAATSIVGKVAEGGGLSSATSLLVPLWVTSSLRG